MKTPLYRTLHPHCSKFYSKPSQSSYQMSAVCAHNPVDFCTKYSTQYIVPLQFYESYLFCKTKTNKSICLSDVVFKNHLGSATSCVTKPLHLLSRHPLTPAEASIKPLRSPYGINQQSSSIFLPSIYRPLNVGRWQPQILTML